MDHEYGIDQTCVRCGLVFADVAKYQLICLPPPDEDCDTPIVLVDAHYEHGDVDGPPGRQRP